MMMTAMGMSHAAGVLGVTESEASRGLGSSSVPMHPFCGWLEGVDDLILEDVDEDDDSDDEEHDTEFHWEIA